MKSTFWMTAQETEEELKRREVGTFVSPFCEHLVFCPNHNKHSDVIDVNMCEECHCTAFRSGLVAGRADRFLGIRSRYSSFVERRPGYSQCYAKGYNEGLK